jgi:hypothetical protein
MYNIRIKSVPNKAKTGSQLDYSLVDRNTLFLKPSDTNVESDIKDTIGAVPREFANIEAEGGETIVGDINNDGFLEHQTIVGKRHSQGGVPMKVPDGSFIFSDTKKLKIKDPNVLNMFGMKPNKGGYTPAEIAKKYKINDYMAVQRDTAKDMLSKRTAELMLNNNLEKLGMLALVQESMKGFPDGIPAIAESVMAGMMGQAGNPEQQEMQTARYGGQLPKAQEGVETGNGVKLSVKDAEKLYNEAVKSKDPKKIEKAIKTIEDYKDSAWYSWGWVPGSNEAAFESLQNKLVIEKRGLEKKIGKAQWIKQNQKDRVKYDQAFQLYKSEFEKLQKGLPSKVTPEMADYFEEMEETNKWKNVNKNELIYPDGALKDLDQILKKLSGNNNAGNQAPGNVTLGQTPAVKEKKPKPAPPINNRPSTQATQQPQVNTQQAQTILNDGVYLDNMQIKYDPKADFAYGGAVQYMQDAGQSGVANDDPVVNFVYGPKGGIRAVTKSGKYVETPYTKYLKIDPDFVNKDGKKGAIRLAIPQGLPAAEKQDLATYFTNMGFKGLVQSSDYKINPKDYYSGFYGGLKPQDFEDRIVREQFGDTETDSMTELQKRREAFKILGVNTDNIPLSTLANAKSLYTDDFIRNTFYPKFTKFLPEGKYRPVMGNDVNLGFEHYDALKKSKPAPQQPQVQPEKDIKVRQYAEQEPIVGGTGWSRNSQLNFLNSALARRYRGFPHLASVNLQTPGYVLEAPNQLIQNAQSSLKNVTELAQNTQPSNVAMASSLGVTGEGLNQAANAISGVNNRSVQTVNQFSPIVAGIQNQEEMFNRGQGIPKFIADVNILGQQKVNADNRYTSNVIKSIISGNKEEEDLQLMKKMFPQVGINNWDRSIGWSGDPRYPFGVDTYVNPLMMGASGSRNMYTMPDYDQVNTAAKSVYDKAYNDMFATMGADNARSYAEKLATSYANNLMRSNNPYQNNPAAMFANMYSSASPSFLDNDV